MSLASVIKSVLKLTASSVFNAIYRWALNFDGIGIRGQLASRAINPDGDIDVEFYAPSNIFARQAIIAQQISLAGGVSEFLLENSTTGNLILVVGGAQINAVTTAQGWEADKKFRIKLSGSSLKIWKTNLLDTDTPIIITTFTRGTSREINATTTIGAANNNSTSSYTRFFAGIQRDVKINGVRWPMADRNQAIQLSEPSGLGAELITQSVLENPAVKGSQWAYLGSGRWQYIGDGSFNELQLIAVGSQPVAGYLEFEVESIDGQMRCNGSNSGVGTLQSNPGFSSVGIFRYYFTDRVAINNGVRFSRNAAGDAVSCIIKNISFKPLGTCNPMTISNATSANWMQVVDDYVRKFRALLNLDGVGIRGQFVNRAINPDGDIDLTFYAPSNIINTTCIVSQNISTVTTSTEFKLMSYNNQIQITVGGNALVFLSTATGYETSSLYRLRLGGTSLTVWKNLIQDTDTPIRSMTFTRGTAREPSALTVLGAETNNSIGTYRNYFIGVQRDVKINGTLWPIADRNQSIQLPEPSGLGVELLDSSPFLEPNGYNNTIVTTGLNSFKVLAPTSGATRAAKGFTLPNASETVVLEFDFVSRDPDALLSLFIRDGSTVGAGTVSWSANINALGKQRFIITNSSITLKNILFAVNLPCTFEIRNISIKPLGICNPIRLANVTSINWEEIEI